MHSMNDERFFDLAMKVIARQCTDAERAEFDALLSAKPELKAEFERLQADAELAREVAPLHAAVEATQPEFPAYARERLQAQVRRTLGEADAAKLRKVWNWRWAFGLAGAAVVLVALSLFNPSKPVIEVAMLDMTGDTRGADTNQVELVRRRWKDARVFSNAQEFAAWESQQPQGRAEFAKIIYDRTAAEVRVSGRAGGKSFGKIIPVENNLTSVLEEAAEFVREQVGR